MSLDPGRPDVDQRDPGLDGPAAGSEPEPAADGRSPSRGRPLVERIGLAAIALVFAALFGFVGVAAFGLGEPFLGVMGLVGCLMTLWVGGLTLLRR